MTIPDFSFLNEKKKKPTPGQKPGVDFSFLKDEQPEIVPPDDKNNTWGFGNLFSYAKNISPEILYKSLELTGALENGNIASYLANNPDRAQYTKDTSNQLVKNAGKFVGEDWHAPNLSGLGGAVKGGIIPKNISKGLAGLVSVPAEAFTATKNEDGTPKPASPEEQAHSIQTLAGIALQGVVASKVLSTLAPALAGEATLMPSRMGTLAKSIIADIPAQAAGGLALGLTENMGQDDVIGKAITTSLAMLPLGVLFGRLHGNKLLEAAGKARAKFLEETVPQTAQELAATKGLQLTSQDAMDDILAKTDAVAKNDSQVHALVTSKLDIGEGSIIDDLTPEQKVKLQNVLNPTGRVNEGVYVPDKTIIGKLSFMVGELNKTQGLGKVIPEFKDTFDKAVYFAGSNSKNAKLIMDDLIDKTGLTEEEISSHRSAIKDYIKKATKDPGQTIIQIPKQNFSGQYGRTPYKYNLYESGNSTLISPTKLNKSTAEHFQKTGFMPGEVASLNGIDVIVRDTGVGHLVVDEIGTGDRYSTSRESLIRKHQHLSSDMWKAESGEAVGRLGLLNRENYFNTLYDKFKQEFVLDKVPDDSYSEAIGKFAGEMGITNKGDIAKVQEAFYSKLQKDVMENYMEPEEVEAINRVREQLYNYNKEFNKDIGNKISRTAMGNGMYIIPKGKGVYDIKSIEDGSVLTSVKSPEEALQFMQKSGATNPLDLDGGNTNAVPPNAINMGTLADPWFFREEKGFGKLDSQFRTWWDTRFNGGGMSKYLVPPDRNLPALDKISDTDFLTHFHAMQRVSGILKAISKSRLGKIENSYNHAVKLTNDVPAARFPSIVDNLELEGKARDVHADLFKFTSKEKALVDKLDVLFNGIKTEFNITPEQYEKVSTNTKLGVMRHPLLVARALIYDGTRNMKVVQDVEAYPGLAKRNPVTGQWFSKNTGSPYQPQMLSFNDVIKNAEKYADDGLKAISDKSSRVNPAHFALFQEHVADVKGIPDLTQQLGQAAQKYLENLYGAKALASGDGLRALTLLTHSSLLGGRLGLTARDIINAHSIAFNQYGPKFALKVMGVGIPKEYAMYLFNSGKIPVQTGLDLMMPNETVSAAMTRLGKIADGTMKWNGNVLAHMQVTAGIYKATIDHVAELSGKMIRNEISKAKAYKELKLQTIDETTQGLFNDYISGGNTQGAADLLAKYRVKQIVNIFGNNNNPIGWNNAWGRISGGMMSWSANQLQTLGDGFLRGSRADRLAFGARWTLTNSAIAAAGYATGLQLNSWLVDPSQLLGVAPLINAYEEVRQAASNIHNPNINARGQAENTMWKWVPHDDKTIAHMYIPYSYMLQDFADAAKMAQTDYGASSAVRWMGIKPIDSRSPLQETNNNYPYIKDKDGTRRRLPNTNQTPIEKKIINQLP